MSFVCKNKKELICYISEYLMGWIVIISLNFSFHDINYIYSYLISSFFIFFAIVFIFLFDKKIINIFTINKKLSRAEKWKFIFMWIAKYLPLLFLLIISIIFFSFNTFFINSYALMVGVIIISIIVFTSEIFKYFNLKIKFK